MVGMKKAIERDRDLPSRMGKRSAEAKQESMSDAATRKQLFALCEQFILDNKVTCPEAIYQTDRVIENAYEFIEEMCNLVGYAEFKDEENGYSEEDYDS